MSTSIAPRGASSKLFEPLSIAGGSITLNHRIIMAPMTRNRGVPLSESSSESPNRVWVPDALMAQYYGQRATDGGLIITESILPSLEAGAMPGVPGMWLPEHLEGWKLVTKAVHAKGGIIYAQLTHHGRAALPNFTSLPTVSASATPFSTEEKYAYPPPGTSSRVFLKDHPPIALTAEHLQATIADHVAAAKMAMEAGFDGVEIHGGNGYLVEQFLSSNINVRTDAYGGSPEKRCRFALDLVEEIGKAIGVQKVAVRLSPFGTYGDVHDAQRWETWSFLCKSFREVSADKLSYVSFIEARKEEIESEGEAFERSWGKDREVNLSWAKECLGPNIKVFSAGGWDGETVWEGVVRGEVEGFVFARWFVSNPDLVERLREGRELSIYNRGKFYGPTSKRDVGYTDYPTWKEIDEKAGEVKQS